MRYQETEIASSSATEKVDAMPGGAAGKVGPVPIVVLWLPMVMIVTIASVFGRADC